MKKFILALSILAVIILYFIPVSTTIHNLTTETIINAERVELNGKEIDLIKTKGNSLLLWGNTNLSQFEVTEKTNIYGLSKYYLTKTDITKVVLSEIINPNYKQ